MSLNDFSFSQMDKTSGLAFGMNVQLKADGAKVYGRCGGGLNCSGGGGQCGGGLNCTGGGGMCGGGLRCAGQ